MSFEKRQAAREAAIAATCLRVGARVFRTLGKAMESALPALEVEVRTEGLRAEVDDGEREIEALQGRLDAAKKRLEEDRKQLKQAEEPKKDGEKETKAAEQNP